MLVVKYQDDAQHPQAESLVIFRLLPALVRQGALLDHHSSTVITVASYHFFDHAVGWDEQSAAPMLKELQDILR